MKTKMFIVIVLSLLVITGCFKNNRDNNSNKNVNIDGTTNITTDEKSMKVIINEKEYTLDLADTKAAQELVSKAPFEVTMKELNGNEKYIYLASGFTTAPFKPNHIEKGDVMLFDNSCIVIFYKSFDTSGYSYTRLGHIDNLPEFDNNDVSVKFEK